VARRAAEELSSPGVPKQTAKILWAPELPPTLNYTNEEEQLAKDEKGIKEKGRDGGSYLTRDSLSPVL
jgi:hypothetical protein